MKVEESLNVTFDETHPPPKTSPLEDDDLVEEEAIEVNKTRPLGNDLEDKSLENTEIINIKESKRHPLDNVIGNLNQRTLRSQAQYKSNFFCFLSTIEPKNINEALKDESWVMAMQEKLNQFISNDVWELVLNPMDMTIIGTKWVYRNKFYKNGAVTRNKARLDVQGYNQQEGIDYDETYAHVARLESIRILLAYACTLNFKLFQMDVKSAFLNGFINEEVYVAQPPGFIDFAKPNHVCRLKKALYELKQAPKAELHQLQLMQENAKESCMTFSSLNLNSSKSIVAANDDFMPLVGIGSVDIPYVTLSDVYGIPSLTMNLASVSKICDTGCDVNFSVSDCCIYDRKTQEVVGKGHRQGDLYVLDHFRDIHDTTSSSVD
ncbi:retrovirus-related pol polyprotein from transposon TNT 1-94, partial [Tanacetum coccineum]